MIFFSYIYNYFFNYKHLEIELDVHDTDLFQDGELIFPDISPSNSLSY